jgi:hypothetical protein
MAVAAVMLTSLAYALLIALRQQRNALRARLEQAKASKVGQSRDEEASRGGTVSQKAQAGKGSTIIQAGRDVDATYPKMLPKKRETDDR